MNEIKQNFPEAYKNFDLAVKNDPNNSLYLCNRGGVLMKLGRDQEALDDFNKAQENFESQA